MYTEILRSRKPLVRFFSRTKGVLLLSRSNLPSQPPPNYPRSLPVVRLNTYLDTVRLDSSKLNTNKVNIYQHEVLWRCYTIFYKSETCDRLFIRRLPIYKIFTTSSSTYLFFCAKVFEIEFVYQDREIDHCLHMMASPSYLIPSLSSSFPLFSLSGSCNAYFKVYGTRVSRPSFRQERETDYVLNSTRPSHDHSR